MRVAAITLNVRDNLEQNLIHATKMVKQATQLGAQWVVLPEMFTYMGTYKYLENIANQAANIDKFCQNLASECGITLFAGSTPRKGTDQKFKNSMSVFSPEKCLKTYDKIHLFHLFDGQLRNYCESDQYEGGNTLATLSHQGFKIGLGICYDIRFPEMFAAMVKHQQPDVFIIPAAFTKATGQAHWHTLLKARAIETQAFIIASNQAGSHIDHELKEKHCYGHSLIISPWGEILADSGAEEGIAIADISLDRIKEVRTMLPALNHRRYTVYDAIAH